jgi:hypothetical protein
LLVKISNKATLYFQVIFTLDAFTMYCAVDVGKWNLRIGPSRSHPWPSYFAWYHQNRITKEKKYKSNLHSFLCIM